MKTKVTELLGIEYPIIQGGMAWVAEYHLAAAVSEAGGLGLIGAASAPADWVRDQIREAKKITDKPFGVNIMLMSPYADDVAKVIVEEGVKVVTTGAGSPEKYMKMWKEAGVKVIPVIASVALAKRMERCGADALVAEGTEAGGHIGESTTMTLVPQVADAVSIPVIAAGGIATGEDIARFMALGASAVQMGSIFVPTEECDASPTFKQTYIDSSKDDIEIIASPVGMPGRAIGGEFIRRVKEGLMRPKKCPFHCIKTCDYTKSPYCIIMALYNAAKGNLSKGYAFCGANAYMSKKITSVRETIESLKSEFAAACRRNGQTAVL